jgi:single-strand DNA-binding protein
MPKSINRVELLGNLGRDPEIKHTQSGTPVARLSLATNERYKDKSGNWQDRTEWHTVILWSRLAEIAGEYLKKGSKILIVGSLKTRSWDQEGTKRYATEVTAQDLIMLDAKRADDKTDQTGPITDEDIPF